MNFHKTKVGLLIPESITQFRKKVTSFTHPLNRRLGILELFEVRLGKPCHFLKLGYLFSLTLGKKWGHWFRGLTE
jgi:hypothetical protein